MCIPWGLLIAMVLVGVITANIPMGPASAVGIGLVTGLLGGIYDSLPGNFWNCLDSKRK